MTIRNDETQALANSTFAAVADKFGAREALRMFNALEADAELLDNAYSFYQNYQYRKHSE